MDDNQPKQAEEVLTRILSRDPQLPEALYTMGHVQQRLGQQERALSWFQAAGRVAGKDVELSGRILYEVANVYRDLHRYNEALQNYQASVAVYPSFTPAHHNLGALYHTLVSHEVCVGGGGRYPNLGALYHILGQYAEAERHYERVLSEEPGNQLLLDNMAKLQRAARAHGAPATPRPHDGKTYSHSHTPPPQWKDLEPHPAPTMERPRAPATPRSHDGKT
ncbi:hypothetical protein ACOMHN_060575 [Nucella lapillus]